MFKLDESSLRAGALADGGGDLVASDVDCVLFLVCLEPGAADPDTPVSEKALNFVVESLQPSPGLLHCELAYFLNGKVDGAATYVGQTANSTRSFGGKREFYFGRNAGRWRAVPIVVNAGAAQRVCAEVPKHVGTCYSLSRYLFSVPPLRAFAHLLPDRDQSAAHCATLAARLLKRAVPEVDLLRCPAFYSPATLFLELNNTKRRTTASQRLAQSKQVVFAEGEEEEILSAIRVLTGGDDDEILQLANDAISRSLRRLAERAIDPERDEVSLRIAQKQLATAILRISVIRT